MSRVSPRKGAARQLQSRQPDQNDDDQSSTNPSPSPSIMYESSSTSERGTRRRWPTTLPPVDEEPEIFITPPQTHLPEAPALIPSFESVASSALATSPEEDAEAEPNEGEDSYAVWSGSDGDDDDGPVENLPSNNRSNHNGSNRNGSNSGNRPPSNRSGNHNIHNLHNHKHPNHVNHTDRNNGADRAPPRLAVQPQPRRRILDKGLAPVFKPADPAGVTLRNQFKSPAPLGDPSLADREINYFQQYPPPTNKDYPIGSEKMFERAPCKLKGIDLTPTVDHYGEETKQLAGDIAHLGMLRDKSRKEALRQKAIVDFRKYQIEAQNWEVWNCKQWNLPVPLPPPTGLLDVEQVLGLQKKAKEMSSVASNHQNILEGAIIAGAVADGGPLERAFAAIAAASRD